MTGDATQNEKRKAVDSQLIADSVIEKYCAAVLETEEKDNQSQDTMILRRTSWSRPKKRRL